MPDARTHDTSGRCQVGRLGVAVSCRIRGLVGPGAGLAGRRARTLVLAAGAGAPELEDGHGRQHQRAAGELHRGQGLAEDERGQCGGDDGLEGGQDGGVRRAGAPEPGEEGQHRHDGGDHGDAGQPEPSRHPEAEIDAAGEQGAGAEGAGRAGHHQRGQHHRCQPVHDGVGDEDVDGVGDRGGEGQQRPERVEAHAAGADQDQQRSARGGHQRGSARGGEPVTAEQHRHHGDHDRVGVEDQSQQGCVHQLQRGEEQTRLRGVPDGTQADGDGQHPAARHRRPTGRLTPGRTGGGAAQPRPHQQDDPEQDGGQGETHQQQRPGGDAGVVGELAKDRHGAEAGRGQKTQCCTHAPKDWTLDPSGPAMISGGDSLGFPHDRAGPSTAALSAGVRGKRHPGRSRRSSGLQPFHGLPAARPAGEGGRRPAARQGRARCAAYRRRTPARSARAGVAVSRRGGRSRPCRPQWRRPGHRPRRRPAVGGPPPPHPGSGPYEGRAPAGSRGDLRAGTRTVPAGSTPGRGRPRHRRRVRQPPPPSPGRTPLHASARRAPEDRAAGRASTRPAGEPRGGHRPAIRHLGRLRRGHRPARHGRRDLPRPRRLRARPPAPLQRRRRPTRTRPRRDRRRPPADPDPARQRPRPRDPGHRRNHPQTPPGRRHPRHPTHSRTDRPPDSRDGPGEQARPVSDARPGTRSSRPPVRSADRVEEQETESRSAEDPAHRSNSLSTRPARGRRSRERSPSSGRSRSGCPNVGLPVGPDYAGAHQMLGKHR
uniref:FunU6 n=1 Tax=Streptosporangium sp. KD35 TaxID=2162663 RepID=A0A2U9KCY2_9ACTN|nr:FunU6 [Streptosporangium sp. KD35]